MQDLNTTKLDRTNTICLLNSLENIEKQARLISCKELDDEMNKRYNYSFSVQNVIFPASELSFETFWLFSTTFRSRIDFLTPFLGTLLS